MTCPPQGSNKRKQKTNSHVTCWLQQRHLLTAPVVSTVGKVAVVKSLLIDLEPLTLSRGQQGASRRNAVQPDRLNKETSKEDAIVGSHRRL